MVDCVMIGEITLDDIVLSPGDVLRGQPGESSVPHSDFQNGDA